MLVRAEECRRAMNQWLRDAALDHRCLFREECPESGVLSITVNGASECYMHLRADAETKRIRATFSAGPGDKWEVDLPGEWNSTELVRGFRRPFKEWADEIRRIFADGSARRPD